MLTRSWVRSTASGAPGAAGVRRRTRPVSDRIGLKERSDMAGPPPARPPSRIGARSAGRPLRGEVGGRLLVRLLELLAGLVGQSVAEHDAVGVVGLVLQAPGEQAVAGELDRLAVEAGAGDGRDVGPRALDEGARERQAAL